MTQVLLTATPQVGWRRSPLAVYQNLSPQLPPLAVLGDDDLSGGSLFSAGRSPPRIGAFRFFLFWGAHFSVTFSIASWIDFRPDLTPNLGLCWELFLVFLSLKLRSYLDVGLARIFRRFLFPML